MCALRRLSMKLKRRPQPAENGEETVATSNNDREKLEYTAYADTKPKTGPVVRDSEDEARSVEESDPFVGEAEVTGVTERFTKKKKYVFRIKIVWSDGSVSHSYRGYTEFFDFHCRLLDLFPEEGGQNPAKERVIPYLPGRNLFKRSDLKLAEERLPQIHEYVAQLLKLPHNISRSKHVIQFFKSSWPEDLAITQQRGDHQKHYDQQTKELNQITPVEIADVSDCVHFTNTSRESNLDESLQFECTDPQSFTSQNTTNVI